MAVRAAPPVTGLQSTSDTPRQRWRMLKHFRCWKSRTALSCRGIRRPIESRSWVGRNHDSSLRGCSAALKSPQHAVHISNAPGATTPCHHPPGVELGRKRPERCRSRRTGIGDRRGQRPCQTNAYQSECPGWDPRWGNPEPPSTVGRA